MRIITTIPDWVCGRRLEEADDPRRQSDDVHVPTYEFIHTASGYAVQRSDGAVAEFLHSSEAKEALRMLESGDASDYDYEWAEPVAPRTKGGE